MSKIVAGAPEGFFGRRKSLPGRRRSFSSVENRCRGAGGVFRASKIVAGAPEGFFDEDLNNNFFGGVGEHCCMGRGLPEVRRVGVAVLRSALRPFYFWLRCLNESAR